MAAGRASAESATGWTVAGSGTQPAGSTRVRVGWTARAVSRSPGSGVSPGRGSVVNSVPATAAPLPSGSPWPAPQFTSQPASARRSRKGAVAPPGEVAPRKAVSAGPSGSAGWSAGCCSCTVRSTRAPAAARSSR